MKSGLQSSSKRKLDKASTVFWSFSAKKNYSSPLFLLNQPNSSPIPYSSLHSAFLSPLDSAGGFHRGTSAAFPTTTIGNVAGLEILREMTHFLSRTIPLARWPGHPGSHKALSGVTGSFPEDKPAWGVMAVGSRTISCVVPNIMLLFLLPVGCIHWENWKSPLVE